jgi:hypothetical protein
MTSAEVVGIETNREMTSLEVTPIRDENREAWLREAAEWICPSLPSKPSFRVSVGQMTGKNSKLGYCYSGTCAEDDIPQLFISSRLTDEPKVLEVLTHELIHAVVGTKCGHRGAFREVVDACPYLEPGGGRRYTATVPTEATNTLASEIVTAIGPYPHAALRLDKNRKPNAWLQVRCAGCGFTAKTTRKHLGSGSQLVCSCNGEPLTGQSTVCGDESTE